MKILMTSILLFVSVSLLADNYVLVKMEEGADLTEARMELSEKFGQNLIGYVHQTEEFVIQCEGECEKKVEELSALENYESRVVSDEEYKEIKLQK